MSLWSLDWTRLSALSCSSRRAAASCLTRVSPGTIRPSQGDLLLLHQSQPIGGLSHTHTCDIIFTGPARTQGEEIIKGRTLRGRGLRSLPKAGSVLCDNLQAGRVNPSWTQRCTVFHSASPWLLRAHDPKDPAPLSGRRHSHFQVLLHFSPRRFLGRHAEGPQPWDGRAHGAEQCHTEGQQTSHAGAATLLFSSQQSGKQRGAGWGSDSRCVRGPG